MTDSQLSAEATEYTSFVYLMQGLIATVVVLLIALVMLFHRNIKLTAKLATRPEQYSASVERTSSDPSTNSVCLEGAPSASTPTTEEDSQSEFRAPASTIQFDLDI